MAVEQHGSQKNILMSIGHLGVMSRARWEIPVSNQTHSLVMQVKQKNEKATSTRCCLNGGSVGDILIIQLLYALEEYR